MHFEQMIGILILQIIGSNKKPLSHIKTELKDKLINKDFLKTPFKLMAIVNKLEDNNMLEISRSKRGREVYVVTEKGFQFLSKY